MVFSKSKTSPRIHANLHEILQFRANSRRLADEMYGSPDFEKAMVKVVTNYILVRHEDVLIKDPVPAE